MGDVSLGRRWGARLQKLASLGSFAVVCLTLSSPASASAASVELPTGTSAAKAEALEVSSYRDDFDVSKQTAEESLEAQSDGAGIAEQLESSEGKSYAGVWFDNESGEFVVPTVPGANPESISASLAGSDLAGDFRTEPVKSSWDELQAAQKRLNGTLSALIEEGLVGTSLDPRANAVVIELAAGANGSQRTKIQAAARGESVKAEVRESQEHQLGISAEACQTKAAACDAPMRGGVDITPKGGLRGSGCTAGFKGIGDTYGSRFMLTAGHCIAEAGGATNWDSFTVAPEARQPLGQVSAYSFPTHDYAAINANGTTWDKPSWPTIVGYWGVNQEYPISYESTSYVGEYVCHVGQQSGLSCGAVTGVHLTEPVEDSAGHLLGYVNNMTKFEHMCAIGGDSGGPVFAASGNVALGIYSGSDKPKGALEPCYYNGYYTEITEDTDLLGVHVAPRIPPPISWHQDNLGGGTTVEPAISSWGAGRLDLFERATDNVLYHRAYNATQWLGWESLGGNLASGPSAASWGTNRIDVVARAAGTNNINHQWFQSGWGGPDVLGTTIDVPAISSWGTNRLDLFERAADNNLYHRAWNGFEWMGWEKIGEGLASGPDAVSWGPGRIDVVAEKTNHSVGHWYWINGVGWSSDNLNGYVTAKPTISSQSENKLDVFARGVDNGLYHLFWTGSGWGNWEQMGGNLTSGPDSVSWGNNRIDVVAADANGQIAHWWYGQ